MATRYDFQPLSPSQQKKVNSLMFKGVAAKRAMQRVSVDRPGDIFPGFNSFDLRSIKAKFQMALEANEKLPATILDHKAGPNAVPSDFSSLLTVMPGAGMDPVTVPVVDNVEMRREAGLSNRALNSREDKIFSDLFRYMFGTLDWSRKLRLRKGSSMMFPFFQNGEELKRTYLDFVLSNVDDILRLIWKGDLETVAKAYGSVPAVQTVYRDQTDKCVFDASGITSFKERMVTDELYARTGGREGRRFAADKRFFLGGQQIPFAQRGRRRTAFGEAGGPSMLGSALLTPMRSYLDRASFTWHHVSPSAKLEKVRQFSYCVGVDVHQHDQFCPSELIDKWCDEMKNILSEPAALLFELMFRSPIFVTDPYLGGRDGSFWIGNVLDPEDFRLNAGLFSGIPQNPDFGKWNMVGTFLCLLDRISGSVLEEGIDVILEGRSSRYGMLNMTDDCVLLFNRRSDYDKVVETFEKMSDPAKLATLDWPFHKIEVESPIVFLGDVFYWPDPGEIHQTKNFKVSPSPVSYLSNFYCNEYPVTARPFWREGWKARELHYSRMPSSTYSMLAEIQDRALYDNYRMTLKELFEASRSSEAAVARRIARMAAGALSTADLMYLLDPASVHYKVSLDEVSPELIDDSFLTIPGNILQDKLGHLYN